MKQSIFKKELSATGKNGLFKAEVIATMNYSTKTIKGTHAATHDDFEKEIPVHKVEIFINGECFNSEKEIQTEKELFAFSQAAFMSARNRIDVLANEEREKTFTEKMIELFK